jgi:predicted DNA-binding transcriptional regulator AlpA
MTANTFLTTNQLASKLGISQKTLEAMRQKGTGPRFQKFGARVLYSETLVTEYLSGRTFSSTSEYKKKLH